LEIVYIKIRNYRCIKELDFTPSKHNILIGRVNSGKSTILSALALALDPDVGRRFRPVEELDFYRGEVFDAEKKPVVLGVEVALSHCTEEERVRFLDYQELWNNDKQQLIKESDDISVFEDTNNEFAFRIGFQAKYDPDEKELAHYWYYPKYSFLGGNNEWRSCPRTDRERVGFFLIPAERDTEKALSFVRYSALDKALRADKISLDDQIAKVVTSVKGSGEFLLDNDDFKKLINEVENRIGVMLEPGKATATKLSFELSRLGHYDLMNILRAFVTSGEEKVAYPVANQGMGAKQIIALATLRMLSERKKRCILAIEEPENNLHPHTQRSLVSDLLKADCQTFITTHSVHVAQVTKRDYLYSLLDIHDGGKRLSKIEPSSSKGELTQKTVKAISTVQSSHPSEFLDCIFAPRVLLVEGKHDREALPVLFRKLCESQSGENRDADGLGIAILPCDSKTQIPNVAPYFKSMGRTVYALVDNEKSTQADNNEIASACDCCFIWKNKAAIERILVENTSEAIIDDYIDRINDLGETYFVTAGTKTKSLSEKKSDLERFLKDRNHHRHFAEFLPVTEVSSAAKLLLAKLNAVCFGKENSKIVVLDEQEKNL